MFTILDPSNGSLVRKCRQKDAEQGKLYINSFQEKIKNYHQQSRVAYFDKKIFIVGGFNGQTRTRSVDIYNPRTKEWTQGSEMICRRGTLGVGLLNRKIYAVGGFDGFSGLSSVECWSMKNNENWSMVASMSTRRSSVGIAVLNNYLYASKIF